MSAFSQRSRPIDATGLFWGFVSVLAGFFYGRIYSTFWFDLAGMALAIACLFWQLQKWSFDRRVNQTAVKWCQVNYPHLGQTPIVDFIVAYCQVAFCDVSQMTPESLLPHSELHWIAQCAHAPMMERPMEFNQILDGFLKKMYVHTNSL